LGFQILSRVFAARASGLHLWSLSAHGLFARQDNGSAEVRVVLPHAPFGVMGGRRLAGPAVFPFGSVSPSKVFAPAIERFADSRRRDALWIFFTDAQGVVRG
jgi:hypothetical protein